ncbi:hypothetical protein ACFLTB_04190 [Chloroflexota bacterium]
MKSKKYLGALTVLGWLILLFSSPAIIAGAFIVLGTAQPWGLVVPVLIFSIGWILIRLDLSEIYWKRTLGEILSAWAVMGTLVIVLIVSRTNSLSLTLWTLPLIYCCGLAGLLILMWSSKRYKASPEQLPSSNSR